MVIEIILLNRRFQLRNRLMRFHAVQNKECINKFEAVSIENARDKFIVYYMRLTKCNPRNKLFGHVTA